MTTAAWTTLLCSAEARPPLPSPGRPWRPGPAPGVCQAELTAVGVPHHQGWPSPRPCGWGWGGCHNCPQACALTPPALCSESVSVHLPRLAIRGVRTRAAPAAPDNYQPIFPSCGNKIGARQLGPPPGLPCPPSPSPHLNDNERRLIPFSPAENPALLCRHFCSWGSRRQRPLPGAAPPPGAPSA